MYVYTRRRKESLLFFLISDKKQAYGLVHISTHTHTHTHTRTHTHTHTLTHAHDELFLEQ